ncbi:MAG: hypothetical protein ABGZ35_11575, partial [Planctomycetaceae bacterium]
MAAKFDFKAFTINHSEKLVGGTVALLVLWGFASASWEHAPVTPPELEQMAEGVRKKILDKKVWPEDQQKAFTVDAAGNPMPDIQELAGELGRRERIGFGQFAMPTVWNEPLVPPRKKQERVVVLAPGQPEVSALAFPLALPLDEEDLELNGALAANDNDAADEFDPVRQRAMLRFGGDAGSSDVGLTQPGLTGDIAGLLLGGRMSGRRGGGLGFGARRGGDGVFAGEGGDEDLGGGYGAGAILPTANRKVEWRSGISVRMIVDLREQRKKIREALHITGDYRSIQEHVDYQQIHIERMQRQDGAWGD